MREFAVNSLFADILPAESFIPRTQTTQLGFRDMLLHDEERGSCSSSLDLSPTNPVGSLSVAALRQTAGPACRSGHNSPTSVGARGGQICRRYPSHSAPGSLGRRISKLLCGCGGGRCRPFKVMGGPESGGMTRLLLGSHAPWHTRVTLRQVTQTTAAVSICSPRTKPRPRSRYTVDRLTMSRTCLKLVFLCAAHGECDTYRDEEL
ncbi:uncharacterized protein LOC116727793 [Xiphophorus hellerii]|uniref:uncharacterized protein LOC116727793 n=1 Tax=Xiphophorus hellerii TaxID=8084 RepID=UPI0013B3AEC7|nr:uncharacterized protein LOC116727793 [Xiphophorus hellerii]